MPLQRDRMTFAQRSRLERFGAARSVDVHCHCLPALDDGPAILADAVAMCRAAAADGTTCLIATPHQLGRYEGWNEPAEIRSAVARLNAALAQEGVPIGVVAGADVRLDERIAAMLAEDRLMTLGDRGEHILLELPHEAFADPRPLLADLAGLGVRGIISHPERHAVVAERAGIVAGWLEAGAAVQITAGSLLGSFGASAEEAAWRLLASGQASLVATEAHDAHVRPPQMSSAIDAIERRLGYAVARRVCFEEPALLLPETAPSGPSAAAGAAGGCP